MNTFAKCLICFCDLNETVCSYDMLNLPMLAHKFVTCTDLPIEEDERLPTELCQACNDQLNQLYAFRAKCIAANTKWHMQILAFCDNDERIYDLESSLSTAEVEDLQLDPSSETTEIKGDTETSKFTLESVEIAIEDFVTKSPPLVEDYDESTINTTTDSRIVYKCDLCDNQYLDKQQLVSHKRRHGIPKFPCPEPGCDKGYSHKHTLSLHMRKWHKFGKEFITHVCEYCGKVFDTLSLLRNHRFTHKDKLEHPFACEQPSCERRFATKQLLKIHMMRHAGIKNYSCTYCGVQKTTRTELKIHLNYHTMERSYCCHLCSKVCYSSSNLNKHIRTIHERARNFACRFCQRTFVQSATRDQHELIHTGAKPHECVECGKCFRQKQALRTHYKTHTPKVKKNNGTFTYVGNDKLFV